MSRFTDPAAAVDRGHFIGGRWRMASAGTAPHAPARVEPVTSTRIALHAPATGASLGTLARGGARDIDDAVAAARAAFEGEWGAWSALQRGRLLRRVALRIEARVDALAWLESVDTGKPLAQGRADILAMARYFEFYGCAAERLHGDTIPFLQGFDARTLREPRGVTGHIVPWNYPAQIGGRAVATTLAAGNACVMKPSEEACLSLLALMDLLSEEDLPAGAVNCVTGYGHEAGAALAAHPGIDLVAFTGSTATGTLVQAAAAANHVPVVLELGGKSPQIVFDDADLEAAADSVVAAIVQNAGQTCSAGSRLLVQASVLETMRDRLRARFERLRLGAPALDGGTDPDVGPLVSARQHARVRSYVEAARADGVPVLAATPLPTGLPEGGHWFAPVALGPVSPGHAIAQEEIFGPVLAVSVFHDEDEAVRLANGTPFGLVAGVWSRDASRLARMGRRLRCGQVYLNCYGAGGGVELPFGGVKHSGHGREKGLAGLEELTVLKTVVQRYG